MRKVVIWDDVNTGKSYCGKTPSSGSMMVEKNFFLPLPGIILFIIYTAV